MRVCVCVLYQEGKTPLGLAMKENHTKVAEVAEVLRKAGGCQ